MDFLLEQNREEIWHWFEETFNVSVTEDLMRLKQAKEDTEIKMNVGLLKELIKDLPDDMQVFVGCLGYCNYDFTDQKSSEDTDTFAIVHDGKLFITDECAVEDGSGNVI